MNIRIRKLSIGAFLALLPIQYIIAEIIVASAWKSPPYSWLHNYISDLGYPICGVLNGVYICSPLHWLMSASFVIQGIIYIVATWLLHPLLPRNAYTRTRKAATVMMVISGLGMISIGFIHSMFISIPFTNLTLDGHLVGALTAVIACPAAIILVGLTVYKNRLWHVYALSSIACGAFELLGMAIWISLMFSGATQTYAGVFERMAVYPGVFWMMATGMLLLHRYSIATRIKAYITRRRQQSLVK